MLPRKVKRNRPTIGTARDWLRDGHFAISPSEHFLSDKDHDALIDTIAGELENITLRFPRTLNLEYAVLKAHLIIEYMVTQYVRAQARVTLDIKDLRFTFSQKLEISYLMGLGANDPIMLPTIEMLNKARNQVAHRFELDRKLVDEMIRINGDSGTFRPRNDRQRIAALRVICSYFCGRIAGEIQAYHAAQKFQGSRVGSCGT